MTTALLALATTLGVGVLDVTCRAVPDGLERTDGTPVAAALAVRTDRGTVTVSLLAPSVGRGVVVATGRPAQVASELAELRFSPSVLRRTLAAWLRP